MSKIPKTYTDFKDEFPDVSLIYYNLGTAVHNAEPLDDKTRALRKLGMSCVAQKEGAVHSQTRKALDIGLHQSRNSPRGGTYVAQTRLTRYDGCNDLGKRYP